MGVAVRRVTPEQLDELAPEDPRARRSRRDLMRVHRAMGSVSILRRAIDEQRFATPPRSVIELGAGDGTLLLRLARALRPRWTSVRLTLLDRHDLVTATTRAGYDALGWDVTVLEADVLNWINATPATRYDLCVANLFLHHFAGADLELLLAGCAARTDTFIGCEPRRDLWGRLGSSCIGILGANAVTRDDAVKSVAAGFRADELSRAWAKAQGNWRLREYRALPFTHCFSAARCLPGDPSQVHGI